MNIKLPCLIALAALAWSPSGATIKDVVSPRTGAFTVAFTAQDLLGEKAGKTAAVITPDETVSWEVYVPEGYREDEPAGVVVFISPSNSGSLRRGWSEARVYIAGFSGGGRVASMVSTEYADTFKGGVFICGVEFWDVDQPRLLDSIRSNRYVFLTGEHDHALESTKRTYRAYRDAGVPRIKLLVVRNLGHENPPRREISKAIEFLDSGSAGTP